METLLAAYAIAWAALSTYVVWLTAGNCRLNGRLKRLEALLGKQPTNEKPNAKVA
jgi:hypothetical protein